MPTPIYAFGIAHLPMLGWLAAAAAPILIHLWSRRKYREMSWAAMEYLLVAVKRQTRRIRFEQWLLLAVRTLLVVLLVLAVAEPYWERAGFALTSAGRTHRVLVVDASYSMAYKPADKNRFDRAKQLARQIVEQSRQGDAFTLVLMARPPCVVVGTPSMEPGEVLEEIDNLKRTDTTIDLPATVSMIRQLVQNARRENPRLTQHEVYFLTDLGRVGWVPELTGAAAADFQRRSRELAESAALIVIDLGQPAAENLAITRLRSLEPVATPAQSVDLETTLKNFGGQARSNQPVELLIDGRRVEQKLVELPAGGEVSVDFSYRFETPGNHAVEVRADGDALEVDNHRWLVVPLRQSIRVLCVDGRPSGEPFRGATDYLVCALSPQGDRAEQPTVRVEVAGESVLLERDLGDYQCVFLCEVAQFTSSEARILDAYLRGGGNLVFFLGEGVLAERYNSELVGQPGRPGQGGLHLLPARLGKIAPKGTYFINPLEYRHPIVRAFRGGVEAGLSSTPITRYFKLNLPKDSGAKVALALTNGDPLIVEEPIHAGRVVLVATSADTSWTPMPVGPGFVPLVQELLAWCTGGRYKQRNVEVGQPLRASVSTPATDVPVSLQTPDGGSRELQLHGDGDYATLDYADTAASGIYRARFSPPIDRTLLFAVNVDTAESDLTQLSVDRLRNEVWPGVDFLYQTTWQKLQEQPAGQAIAQPGRLHVDLLYIVLGLLFLETFLAWRFGH